MVLSFTFADDVADQGGERDDYQQFDDRLQYYTVHNN